MKKITAFLILLCCTAAAFSQKVYFVYLQSDGGQPFFLKMNEQVLSSNSSGYLILSQLKDSTYNFSIGFPQNKWPEQVFAVQVGGKDRGFLLKKDGEADWGLVDLQTEQKIPGQTAMKQRSVKTEPKEVSQFTDVLSKAANDPSLRMRVIPVVAKKEEKVPEQVAAAKKEVVPPAASAENKEAITPAATEEKKLTGADKNVAENKILSPEQLARKDTLVKTMPAVTVDNNAVAAEKQELPKEEPKKEELPKVDIVPAPVKDTLTQATAKPEEKKPVMAGEKSSETLQVKTEQVNQEAVAPLAVVDTAAGQATANPKKEGQQQPAEVQQTVYKPSVVRRRTESSTTEGFGVTYIDEYPDGKKDTIQIMIPNPKTVIRNVPPPQEDGQFLPMDSEAKDLTPAKKEQSGNTGNNCNSMASETDYLKLRKKMVATDGDDAMLAAAKKVFKTKCFTTEQVRNLGTLFLNDAGRYSFFDAAYLSVSDRENFAGLQAELKDAYYVSRFKAMLR